MRVFDPGYGVPVGTCGVKDLFDSLPTYGFLLAYLFGYLIGSKSVSVRPPDPDTIAIPFKKLLLCRVAKTHFRVPQAPQFLFHTDVLQAI